MSAVDQFEYQQKYVLFLDVLGWSSLMADTKTGLARAKSVASCLAEAFQEGCDKVEESRKHPATPRFEFFSDSMLVTIPFVGGEVYWPEEVVFSICKKIALSTLEHGFLVRGGLTRGDIYHDAEKHICFGPALVRAYELESKVANYPRIVIDQSIVDFLNSHDLILAQDCKSHGLHRTPSTRVMDDGVVFYDYLAPQYLESGKVAGDEIETFEKNMRLAKSIVAEGNKTTSLAIAQKYNWFSTYIESLEKDYSRQRFFI